MRYRLPTAVTVHIDPQVPRMLHRAGIASYPHGDDTSQPWRQCLRRCGYDSLRSQEPAAIVIYVDERPTLPPDCLRTVMEMECVQDFIKTLH